MERPGPLKQDKCGSPPLLGLVLVLVQALVTVLQLGLAPPQIGAQRGGRSVLATLGRGKRGGRHMRIGFLIAHGEARGRVSPKLPRPLVIVKKRYSPTFNSILCARMTATARLAAYSGAWSG